MSNEESPIQVNENRWSDIFVHLVLGIGSTILVYGVVFIFSIFVAVFVFGGSDIVWTAGGITGLFLAVGFISAWRDPDPLEGISRLSQGEKNRKAIEGKVANQGGGIGTALNIATDRRKRAGIAHMLVSGPLNLLKAWAAFRS